MIRPHDPTGSPPDDPDPSEGKTGENAPSGSAPLDGEDPSGWTPFDPGEAPRLPDAPEGAGRVVAIVASPELVGVGWALPVAVELARAWAAQRPGLVLVDTDFSRPRMHHTLRVDNATGLAEILRGDAPVSEATRVVEEDRFFCVPAGNTPEEPDEAFDGDRWTRFCRAFVQAGVTVVAYVPGDASWAPAVVASATDMVELREQDDVRGVPPPSDPAMVLARLGPMPIGRTREHPSVRVPQSTPTGGAAGGRHVPAESDRRRRRRRILATVGLVTGALALGLILRGMGIGTAATAVDTTDPDPPSSTAVSEPRPVPAGLHFSIAVAAYGDHDLAERRAAQLAAVVPDVPWYLAPVRIGGMTYQRVLGGLVPDSSSATALASRLAGQLGVSASGWVVRATDVVVDLGEASDQSEAEEEAARMRGLGLPASVARIAYSDGSVRYRIYAGGYADTDEAAHLLGTVTALGLTATTSPRLGAPARAAP